MRSLINAEKIDSGSNYNFPDKMEVPNKLPRSVFNLSNTVSGTIPNAGMIIPLEWFEYVPGDSFRLSVRHILRVMPQVVPLYSRQRIFFHAFAMNYGDMQNDFGTLMTKGYSGNVIKHLAQLNTDNLNADIYDSGDGVVTPDSLADYLGLPQGATYADLIEAGISAMPFFMYEAIYKYFYMNANFKIDNRNWLPDDIDSFRMNEAGQIMSNTDETKEIVDFGRIHYRDYPDDYFTSALPFAQRGNRPTLDLSFGGDGLFNFSDALRVSYINFVTSSGTTTEQFNNAVFSDINGIKYLTGGINTVPGMNFASITGSSSNVRTKPSTESWTAAEVKKDLLDYQNKLFNDAVAGNITTQIGVDNLRELIRQQIELEKMARTDGSYNEFGLTFFGRKPKTGSDHRPIYIGGSYDQISFTEVVQTSQSSVSSALGQIAGHGISVNNNGFLGSFTADDYGIIMIVCTIMPDVYYHQGLDKKWTKKYQSEFYLPERAKLGLQPVLNKELFFTGTPETDDDLFGYQNPFDDLRYMRNRICGKIADPNNESFYPYTQARRFESTPTLSQSFAVADDVRKDYLFAKTEDAYSFQCTFEIRAVRPLPYKPVPNNFGF